MSMLCKFLLYKTTACQTSVFHVHVANFYLTKPLLVRPQSSMAMLCKFLLCKSTACQASVCHVHVAQIFTLQIHCLLGLSLPCPCCANFYFTNPLLVRPQSSMSMLCKFLLCKSTACQASVFHVHVVQIFTLQIHCLSGLSLPCQCCANFYFANPLLVRPQSSMSMLCKFLLCKSTACQASVFHVHVSTCRRAGHPPAHQPPATWRTHGTARGRGQKVPVQNVSTGNSHKRMAF